MTANQKNVSKIKKQIIDIDKLIYGGDGLGRLKSKKVIFVPNTIPGEKHLVEIVKEKKSYAYGKSIKILKKSEQRIKPKCKVFNECGGCQWQHLSYKDQKKHKEKVLKNTLLNIGKIKDHKINDIIGVDYSFYYRNKATIPIKKDENNKITAGFYKRGTHQVIDNDICHIQHQLINRIKKHTLEIFNEIKNLSVYDEKKHQGLLRHLHIRVGICTNQAILTIVTSENEFPELPTIAETLMNNILELKGVIRNINKEDTNVILGDKNRLIKGQDYIYDYIGNRKFKISHDSFFQINTLQSEKLYEVVKNYADLSNDEIIVDAFSGIGSISLYLKNDQNIVYGIENNKKAVSDSRENSSINELRNCNFIFGDVKEEIPKLIKKSKKPDIVIFDPPRSGLNESIIKTVIDNDIKKVIYVSCDPTTLARDLKKFKKHYNILNIQPVDMFPQTYHIETVVFLRRGN